MDQNKNNSDCVSMAKVAVSVQIYNTKTYTFAFFHHVCSRTVLTIDRVVGECGILLFEPLSYCNCCVPLSLLSHYMIAK